LTRCAITSDASTFEDSIIESESLSKNLGFPIVVDKFVALGKNSHVSQMVKIGDKIKASDSLIVFENSFNESDVNEILRKLGQEFGQEVLDMGRNSISAKMTGQITDIRIFYNVPINELSLSLQKIVNNFIKDNKNRSKIMLSNKSDDIVQVSQMSQVKYDKLFGQTFDGILIQFFISHIDQCTTGDKISAQVALKGVISTVLSDDERPYTEENPKKPIDLVVSPMSIISRMTVDLFYNLYGNKLLVELKEKCRDIWES
jgi:DNA-directed RNA polymerase beta subunit